MEDILDDLRRGQPFFPVVPFDPSINKLLLLDFTSGNNELSDVVLHDNRLFTIHVMDKLAGASALYGIGGYQEHRTIYSRSVLFDGGDLQAEPRRLHLGTDIWGKPHTPVRAPLDGIVHSYANNDRRGDYGSTIILSHRLGDRSFFTLYGHLGRSSIQNLAEGDSIRGGDIFAEFGVPSENGQWPPHLHFQLIMDIGSFQGDYPGVCRYSEREQWLINSPDPDIILQLNRYL